MSVMDVIVRGEIIGADFTRDDVTVIHVAVPTDTAVGHHRVVIIEAEYYEASLPTVDAVRGILKSPPNHAETISTLRDSP